MHVVILPWYSSVTFSLAVNNNRGNFALTSNSGHFDIDSPQALYRKIIQDYCSFCDDPNSFDLFDVLTGFNHLLEWICPEAYGKPPKPNFKNGTPQQQFYHDMWNTTDYQMVKELCNRAKHFQIRKAVPKVSRTNVVKGARAGLLRAGDSLGQTYFIVNEEDVRDLLVRIYKRYQDYFRC